MKTRVAVLFGGRSVEHEVSIISGLQAYHAIDRSRYEPLAVYISKNNDFYVGEGIDQIESFKNMPQCLSRATRVLPIAAGGGTVELVRYPMKKFGSNVAASFDVAVPVVHGTNVEDGTLMGLLELLGVPYAACDVTSSAVGMDKYLMKAALRQAGLPVLEALSFSGREIAVDGDRVLEEVESRFAYPVIVKPVNLGSSVGISKAGDRAALRVSLDEASGFAARVLVEPAVAHLREINCAVLGDAEEAVPSVCERPVNTDEILSYRDKYIAGGKGGEKSSGMNSLKRICPADIPDELTKTVQELAVKTFRVLGCMGVARIDFLNDTESGELWVNEINTIPGSLAFYLWEAAGVSFEELMTRLIELAFKRHRNRESITFQYDTNILDGFGGAKGAKSGGKA